MLDRATRCLNHGGRQTCSLKNSTFHSRRLLHSAFWRHGAGDLENLPTWCFSTVKALFEPETPTGQDDTTAGAAGSYATAPLLLDFLYSRKTKAYLKRLTAYGAKSWKHHVHSSDITLATRMFGSTARTYWAHEYAAISASPAVSEPLPRNPTAQASSKEQDIVMSKLVGYWEASERGEYLDNWVSAWSLYSSIPVTFRTSSLIARMMDFMAKSPRALDAKRVVRLLAELPLEARQPADVVRAIEAHFSLGELGKAFRLGEQALRYDPKSAATPIFGALMTHAVTNNNWQLALRVWDIRSEGTIAPENVLQSDNAVFQEISATSRFSNRVKALISLVEHFPEIATTEHRKALVLSLVTRVFHGAGITSASTFGGRQNVHVLGVLKDLGLKVCSLYDLAISRTLTSRDALKQEGVEEAFALYRVATSQKGFVPSLDTMRTLLNRANVTDYTEVMYTLFNDWPRFHGVPLIRDTHLFMTFFANRGDTEFVQMAFDNYIGRHRVRNVRLFHPRLHVYALAADVKSVERIMFAEMQKASLEPDIVCWNILLHAFQRADDLDGAMGCLSRLLQSNLTPDDYSFGTVMSIAADRGDLDLMEQLHQAAQTLGIAVTQVMNDCYVQALLHNHAAQTAETFARSITKNYPNDKTRMWNQILTYYTLDHKRGSSYEATIRLSSDMQRLGVPFDSMTFSAIMRAYILQGRPAVAKRIMYNIMARRNIKITPFHYALLINGYTNLGMFDYALRIEKDMLKAGVKPDISAQLAVQKLHLSIAGSGKKSHITQSTEDDSSMPNLAIAEELIEESLGNAANLASKGPRLSERNFGILDAQPGALFDFLLSFYGRARAFDMVKAVLERYEEFSQKHPAGVRRTPLRLLVSLMTLRYHQRDHDEVSRYWSLAKRTAVTAFGKIKSRRKTWLPHGNLTVLARHLDVYMRSLAGQAKHGKILVTVQELFDLGFDLDNRNWNLYVQLIATKGLYVEAFSTCERHLMPSFNGWRLGAQSRAQKNESSLGMELQDRSRQQLQLGELRVEYKTVVRLAHVVKLLRQRAPFEVQSQTTLTELERKAPKTFEAVMKLPVRGHPTATHVLGKVERVRERGEL